MKRAIDDAYGLTQALRDEGLTEEQIVDELRRREAQVSDESELYRTTFRSFIDAMRGDLVEASVREDAPDNLNASSKP